MNQKNRVLEYLNNHESLNPLQAWRELGVYRLAAVICELRKDGVPIQTDLRPVINQFDEECRVGHYSLRKE